MSSEEKKGTGVKHPIAIQKARVEKLMKNPDKPINIPGKKEEKLPRVFNPPEFYRNVWGSSAGAGSGDFHLYRCIRRREYARERYLDMKSEKEELNQEFAKRLEENKQQSEAKTAKKRAKRQKKKMKQKGKKSKAETQVKEQSNDEDDSDSEDDTSSDDVGAVTDDNGDSQQPHSSPDGGQDSSSGVSKTTDSAAAQQQEYSVRCDSTSTGAPDTAPSADTGETISRTHDDSQHEH